MLAARAAVCQAAANVIPVILFKGIQAGFEQVALRDHNDINTWRNLVPPKNFSNQSFSPVPLDGPTELLGSGDSQSADPECIGQGEQRAVAASCSGALVVNPLKIDPATNSLVGLERRHAATGDPPARGKTPGVKLTLFATDRQPFAPLGAPALQDQTPVFRAHANQKPVRLAATAPVGLKCALAFHVTPSEENEPSIVTKGFRTCQ